MPLLRILRPTLADPDRRFHHAHAEHGPAAKSRHFPAALTHDIKISVSDFTLALAVQNLAWGFLQPLAGAMTVRYGFRPIMMVGSLFYIVGLALLASAQGMLKRDDRRRRADRHLAGVHRRRDRDGRLLRARCRRRYGAP